MAASPHGDAVLRQAVTSVPAIPYTTSVDVNPRDARLDDTSPKFPLGQPAENPVVSATRQNVPAWLLPVVMYSGVS